MSGTSSPAAVNPGFLPLETKMGFYNGRQRRLAAFAETYAKSSTPSVSRVVARKALNAVWRVVRFLGHVTRLSGLPVRS